MRRHAQHGLYAFLVSSALTLAVPAAAQDEVEKPPPIGPFAVDVRGTFPPFPNDVQRLADSRNLLSIAELPGRGLGLDLGGHVYPFRWRAITFGFGGHLMIARAHQTPDPSAGADLRPVSERFVSLSPQLSLNFGTGRGWSYLSAGLGSSTWSIHYDGAPESIQDQERLRTFDYGGGARWFAKKHLAFTVDARFYGIDEGQPVGLTVGSPATTLFVLGVGISVK
jgi:hypothetical protein